MTQKYPAEILMERSQAWRDILRPGEKGSQMNNDDRRLSIAIGNLILDATKRGMSTASVVAVLEEHLGSEKRILESQKQNERSY